MLSTNFYDGLQEGNSDEFIAALHDLKTLYKDETGCWVVSAFEQVKEALLDHERFSSHITRFGFPLLTDDPPRHTMLRSLVSRGFTPVRIESLRPGIEAIAGELASNIESGREIDIVPAFALPLPVAVIARMLGVPAEDNARFKRWSEAIIGLVDTHTLVDLRRYFAEVVAARRAALGEDLISVLLRATEEGASLTDADIVGFATLLLIAGNETTTNLLGNMLHRLAAKPEQFARLRADPSGVDAAIDEALRLDSPAQFVIRVVREDTHFAGHDLKKGELLHVYLAAANRDPDKWMDPANFDVARERARHIAFGHGVHACIGAPLARLEAQIAMRALLSRFTSVSHGGGPAARVPSVLLYGFRSLPLVFH